MNVLLMLGVLAAVNGDVVQVHHDILVHEMAENLLKVIWRIGETERQTVDPKESKWAGGRCYLFSSRVEGHVVVAALEVQGCKVPLTAKHSGGGIDDRNREGVCMGDGVHCSIVDAYPFSIVVFWTPTAGD